MDTIFNFGLLELFLDNNKIVEFDGKSFPNLVNLNLDNNKIFKIKNESGLTNLN